MDDLLREFLTESADNLQQLDDDLAALQRAPGDQEIVRRIFRTVHTIKGTCGFLGLERLAHVAHAAENVLVLLRDGALEGTPEIVSDVLAATDVIHDILTGLETGGDEPAGDDRALIAALDRWSADADVADEELTPTPMAVTAADATAIVACATAADIHDAAPVTGDESDADFSDVVFPVAPPRAHLTASRPPVAAAGPADEPAPPPPAHVPTPSAETGPSAGAADAGANVEATLRVNVALLDRLMNMVGELVLTRNQLLQVAASDLTATPAGGADARSVLPGMGTAFLAPVQQLNRVTTDLQEAVMKTRMQPIGAAWTKLPRLVRELAATMGKPLDLEMHGQATELDRQVLQAIQDPLTHMVRNAADHGVENPADRRAAGKPARGRITLNAYHEGGHVVVEVSDDGAGIDPARVRRKAVERGLATAEAVAALSDAQVLRFVFEPGFSTAAQVTSVSGRGVGMDVVKSNIERIGGTVDLASRPGQGCTVRVRIPLTLAIVPALVVRVCDQAFAIPQVGVVELVRLPSAAASDAPSEPALEQVGGAHFLRLRDTLLPLVHLGTLLGLTTREGQTDGTVVVCQAGASHFGVVVDAVFDTQEIVVKPVGRLVRHIDVFAGCTILGDGRVIMILDTVGMATRACVFDAEAIAATARGRAEEGAVAAESQTTALLLFDAGTTAARRAVPLGMVARLEEVPADRLEFADGRWVVQSRGTLLPVVPATPDLDVPARDPRPLIVFRDGDRAMGLAVDAIRDIVDTPLHFERQSTNPELMGVTVVDGRATEIVDIQHFLRQARADWFAARPGEMYADRPAAVAPGMSGEIPGLTVRDAGPRRVLLVDDSHFFLSLLAPVVRSAGYHVTTSNDGAHALDRLGRGERFDLILSDIDMPQVDGYELARRVRDLEAATLRSDESRTPMIALTGRATKSDAQRAHDAGFDHFMTKFEREALVAALTAHLDMHAGTARELQEVAA